MGKGSGYLFLSEGNSSGNVLVAFYWKLPMERKGTSFGVKYKNVLVGQHLLKLQTYVCGNTDLYKVCCDHYHHFYS